MNSNALIILEIKEPNKAPDLRYITISSSLVNKLDSEFGQTALEIFKSEKKYSSETTITVKQVIRFGDYDSYKTFFNSQIEEYLGMENEVEIQNKKNVLMHLGNIITFEGQSLETLADSKEKTELLNLQFKLMPIQDEIASQPEGRIELKKSGNLFITGFSENVRNLISNHINGQ
ncbi:hypothetical protein [Flavobacterium selenitireducens]|uniref:hypothetical protein n=1 Tax=Flavobacterium selenitireducens TaxID=2722704 RepID=UPI00168BA0C2|nr:hypothetical protein [Flavobacterium selenitireducens]MBD3584022.1 hypothetical protein [Flavobacterium selenitireducens]